MKILQLRGYVLFLSLGLVLFFLGALSVILVRTKSSSMMPMPNLVGKNYYNIHNEMVRLRLKILIENSRIPEKNDGEILSQSVAPGKSIESGSHVYLTVNQGYDRIEVPNLKGQSLQRGKELLDKVLSGEIYVSMPIGGITYIPAEEGENTDMIVDQIPSPGKITHSGEKIYLLVTEKPNSKSSKKSKSSTFLDQPFPFVAKALNRSKVPWKITSWEDKKFREREGLVSKETVTKEGLYEFVVDRIPKGNSIEEGYEFLEWKAENPGTYQVNLIKGELGELENFLLPLSFQSGEELKLALYRVGKMQADVLTMDNRILESFTWKPDSELVGNL